MTEEQLTGSNTPHLKIVEEVTHQKIKCLIYAAYLSGQEAGLNRMTFNNPKCIEERCRLVKLILKDI